MNKIEKHIDQIIEILFHILILAMLGFLIVGFCTFPNEIQNNISTCETLDIDWYQVKEDGSQIPAEVPGKCDIPWGQTMTLTGTLPESLKPSETPWLCLHSSLQDLKVYINGELRGIYTTENTRLWGKNSVSVYYFVHLKQFDNGKEIRVMSTSDSKYSGVMHPPYCGTIFGIYKELSKGNLFEVICALLLLLMSAGTIIISIIMQIRLQRRIFLTYLGWTELLLSLWILSESPLRQLYFPNISLAGYITHFVIYLVGVPLILYFDYAQQRRHQKMFRGLLVAELTLSLLAPVLEITAVANFSLLFKICAAVHLIVVGYIVFTIIRDIQNGFASKNIFIYIGFLGFVITGILQLAMYTQNTVVLHGGFLAIGALFWLLMSILSALQDYFHLERENLENQIKAQKLSWQAMTTLVQTIEAKDTYTKGHSTRVAEYSRLLSKKMGKNHEEQSEIYYMGMLHDIGKIGIADSIINKPGRLTDEEYGIIKTHPVIGYQILKNMNEIKNIEYGARWHHERYDGKGYPDGLAGEDIPEYARIIAVADAYDAMTSNRSYRKIMPQNAVRAEIARVRGTQLDPDIAAYMLELIDEDKDYELRQKNSEVSEPSAL